MEHEDSHYQYISVGLAVSLAEGHKKAKKAARRGQGLSQQGAKRARVRRDTSAPTDEKRETIAQFLARGKKITRIVGDLSCPTVRVNIPSETAVNVQLGSNASKHKPTVRAQVSNRKFR